MAIVWRPVHSGCGTIGDVDECFRGPPGPPLFRLVQTAGFMPGGARSLQACRRRYGNVFTFGTLFDMRLVMVSTPA
jgi:hypothetical protein